MLRVGLTGGLGAGKSTVARLLAERGAVVLSSDEIGRELMRPGEAVYVGIVERFGSEVVREDRTLDRAVLARLAFEQGRLEELNALVHPAVIARQEKLMLAMPEDAVVVVESALLFETKHSGPEGWQTRFDRIVLVTAPEEAKIARFVDRAGGTAETRAALEAEARRRLAAQMPDAEKMALCDYVVRNDLDVAALTAQVDEIREKLHVTKKAKRTLDAK